MMPECLPHCSFLRGNAAILRNIKNQLVILLAGKYKQNIHKDTFRLVGSESTSKKDGYAELLSFCIM